MFGHSTTETAGHSSIRRRPSADEGAGRTRPRVEIFEAIRKDHQERGLSIRALAHLHRVHRRTVRAALDSPTPPPRKPRDSIAPKLDQFSHIIDELLSAEKAAPHRKRITARQIHQHLVETHQAVISYSTVRSYVARCRPTATVDVGSAPAPAAAQEHEVTPAREYVAETAPVRNLTPPPKTATEPPSGTAGARDMANVSERRKPWIVIEFQSLFVDRIRRRQLRRVRRAPG